MNPSNRDPGGYDPALDGLRAVAIILVMGSHFTEGAPRVPVAIRALAGSGWMGVDLFFVLSGFLITGICLDNAGPGFFRAFYARRALRILPPYATVLALILVGDAAFSTHSLHNVWALPAFGANIVAAWSGNWSALPQATWHFWSLAVEEQFYLIWPWAVVLLSRRAATTAAIAAIPLALAIRVALVLLGANPLAPYVLMPARMDSLAAGAVLAMLLRRTQSREAIRGALRGVASAPTRRWLAGLVVLCLIVSSVAPGVERYSRWMDTVGLTVIGAAAALTVAAVAFPLGPTPLRQALSRPYVVAIGRYSYAMYLIQVPLNVVLRSVGFVPTGTVSSVAFTLCASAMTFGLAAVSWRLVEAPVLSLKRHAPYRRSPERAVVAVSERQRGSTANSVARVRDDVFAVHGNRLGS